MSRVRGSRTEELVGASVRLLVSMIVAGRVIVLKLERKLSR